MDVLIDRNTQTVDVSRLPTITYGHKGLMWWGTMGFMVIEGWTVGLCVMGYFYLRHNFESWPPLRTPNPSLLIPTINLGVMLVSLIPSWWTAQRAKALDRRGVTIGLLVSGAVGLTILALRWFDLWSLNTRWDTNAYGSAAWLVVGMHATLLLVDIGDTLGLCVMFAMKELPAHYYPDTVDNTMYWFFTVLAWIPLYLIVYAGPYFL